MIPVSVQTRHGNTATVIAAVATTPAQRTRGLMGWHLVPGTGMLFVFSDMKVRSFWMKDVPTDLDILFIDQHLRVVGIVKNAAAMSRKSFSVGKPSKYVLEVSGGWSAHNNVGVGAQVNF